MIRRVWLYDKYLLKSTLMGDVLLADSLPRLYVLAEEHDRAMAEKDIECEKKLREHERRADYTEALP